MQLLMIFNGIVYTSLWVVYPTDYIDTGGVIYILFASEYYPANKTITTQLLLGNRTHILSTLDIIIPPLLWIPLAGFLMLLGYNFSSVQVPFEYTTVALDTIDEFLDTSG